MLGTFGFIIELVHSSALGRSPKRKRKGNSNPFQYACLENPRDGWRDLVGYSPRGSKESDMTEQLTLNAKCLALGRLSGSVSSVNNG